jgi:PAS domain S-box-containing protein
MHNQITFQEVLEHIGNGVIVTDKQGLIVHINLKAAGYLENEQKQLVGGDIRKLLPSTGDEVMNCISSGRPYLGEIQDNNQVGIVINITPIFDVRKKTKGSIINFQQIHQFEKYAHELNSFKTVYKQLETIFDTSEDGIWVCDGVGRIVAMNRASEHLNGIKADEYIGKPVSIMEDRNIVDKNITPDVIRTRQKISRMQYNNRTYRHLLVTAKPAFDEAGNVLLVVVNERDMTQFNHLQEKLEESRLQAQKAKSELSSMNLDELRKQNIIAAHKSIKRIYKTAIKLSQADASNILILGESGTGKGLLSKFIHQNSSRSKQPFIQINCAALPESLLEAELFGYEKGAFTGARDQGKAGLFELAHRGTLFLDEIGDMPLVLQAKLLTYLDNHEVLRLGSTIPRKIDCQLIAATNLNLASIVKAKKFRQDLFYRLNTFTIKVPPLRERPDDIYELALAFLAEYNSKYKKNKQIHEAGIRALQNHTFSGNVRELQNIIKEAIVICESRVIDRFILDKMQSKHQSGNTAGDLASIDLPLNLQDEMDAYEKRILEITVKSCHSTANLAESLGISQPTAFRKLRKHRINIKKKPRL